MRQVHSRHARALLIAAVGSLSAPQSSRRMMYAPASMGLARLKAAGCPDGLPDDIGHLRSGIRGRHDDLDHVRPERDRFGETCRGPAADSDDTIDPVLQGERDRLLRHRHRWMHAGA